MLSVEEHWTSNLLPPRAEWKICKYNRFTAAQMDNGGLTGAPFASLRLRRRTPFVS